MKMAIILQNIIQYYSLLPFLKLVKKKNYWENDIYIIDPQDTKTGFSEIMEELKQAVIKDGFKIASQNNNKGITYQVCLSPYQNTIDIKYNYLINYYYGALNAKPFTFSPELKANFHGFLLHSNYDADILSAYGKTYIVPRLSLREIKPNKHSGKQRLLYLPTYGKESNIENVIKILPTIKDRYIIIVKGHHGTAHLKNENSRKTSLEMVADYYYGPTKNTQELFEEADIVLSDNSGAIFDALYVKKPVCILSNNIDNDFIGIHPLQKKLVEDGIIPYSKKATTEELLKILQQTLSPKIIKRQNKESDYLFPNKNAGVEEWVKILKNYMENNINTDYIKIHNHLITERASLKRELENAIHEKNKLLTDISSLTLQLNDATSQSNDAISQLHNYENGKLYKIAKKIYEIKNGKK